MYLLWGLCVFGAPSAPAGPWPLWRRWRSQWRRASPSTHPPWQAPGLRSPPGPAAASSSRPPSTCTTPHRLRIPCVVQCIYTSNFIRDLPNTTLHKLYNILKPFKSSVTIKPCCHSYRKFRNIVKTFYARIVMQSRPLRLWVVRQTEAAAAGEAAARRRRAQGGAWDALRHHTPTTHTTAFLLLLC